MQSSSEHLSHTIVEDWKLPEEISAALEQQINLTIGHQLDTYAHVL